MHKLFSINWRLYFALESQKKEEGEEGQHFDRFSFSVLQYWRLHTGETIKTALYESKF